MKREKKEQLSKGAASGVVALIFLVLGFQLALFVIKVAERPRRPAAVAEADTAAVQGPPAGGPPPAAEAPASAAAPSATPAAAPVSKWGGYDRPARPSGKSASRPAQHAARRFESFPFDPNTVTVADLQRLGLSARQAESIENYRSKGGRFRSKADFQKMYVVSDTLFARLESYIEIPKLELNTADSAALVTLRGIGPWYARKILDYRERLGGYIDKAQLLEIDGIDAERYAGFSDDITVDASQIRQLDLWHSPDSLLARHPYLGPKGARSILRFRQLYDTTRWNPATLRQEGVLPADNIEKLEKYIENQ